MSNNTLWMVANLDTSAFDAKINAMSGAVDKVFGKFAKMFAMYKTFEFGKESLEYHVKLEQANVRIAQALKNQNAYSEQRLSILKKQRDEMARSTFQDPEKIAEAQALVAMKFGTQTLEMQRMMTLGIVNTAVQGHQSIEVAARQTMAFAKSYLFSKGGGQAGLARSHMPVGGAEEELIKWSKEHPLASYQQKLEKYMDAVNKSFAKFAEETAKVDPMAALRLEINLLKDAFGEVVEVLVRMVTPTLLTIVRAITDFIKNDITRAKNLMKDVVIGLLEIWAFTKLKKLTQAITPTVTPMMTVNAANVTVVAANMLGGGAYGRNNIGFGKSGAAAAGAEATAIGGGAAAGAGFFARMGGMISKALPALGTGLMVSGIGNIISDLVFKSDKNKKSGGNWADVAGFATTGAMLGSIIPGIGTAIGALAGTLVGFGEKVWKSWDELNNIWSTSGVGFFTKIKNSLYELFGFEFGDKKEKEAKLEGGDKSKDLLGTGLKGTPASSTVHGSQQKVITININDGLINHLTNNFHGGTKEVAKQVENQVTQAVLNGLEGAQLMTG